MVHRKSTLLLLTGSLAAVIVVFLSLVNLPNGSSSPSTKGGETVTPMPAGQSGDDLQHIIVSVSIRENEFDDMLEATSRFMEANPNITVELRNVSPDLAYDSLKSDAQLGTGPDIALMDNGWVKEFAVLGYLKPLDSLVATMPGEWLGGLLEPLNWNNYWWGMPKDADPQVVVWSRPLLNQLTGGVVPSDWSSLADLAAKVGAVNSEVPIVQFDPSEARELLVWMDSFPSKERTELLQPFESELKERLTFLAEGQGSAFTVIRSSGGDKAEKLAAGELLSAVMPWSDLQALTLERRSKLATSYPNGWFGGRSFVVFSHSRAKDEAVTLWLKQMAGSDEQQAAYERYRLLPSLKPLYATREQTIFDIGMNQMADFVWLKQLDATSSQTPDPQWPIRLANWKRVWNDLSRSDEWLAELAERWNDSFT
ncbi:ABC-type glycerol-3-phosphate transport system substrate-binding protein [Paenibacillus cellulosilyticus]|uniref:ABC-type glycerol-3-phosphate transport system substrate-binding protein n=1 Tax=Paenibacillus cellulosilyticus TaxID=375489 RepID=A0A2V2YMM9_9BACL|nr:extracellular solute-binding protein [Paenibacillus cellulosilyticus]PWV95447.1 ABC-type glycerol-3-phosphate transport system substrate-binding protein [Paenibacillus cellulosilyticus]QKS43178.1 extracellular solute-binding protein [Paenibacillus cellulosilyticus]